ncbi:hypothetical protein NIES4075_08470 [Tolypothrix sp. NIES-4075]|nr:hypothetical protein NIES4075_08470 [Tolypothrix sp. NIES-4075]
MLLITYTFYIHQAARGGKAFRFDTDRFPTQVQLNVYYGKQKEQQILVDEDKKLDLSEVSAVSDKREYGCWFPSTFPDNTNYATTQD